MVPDGDDYQPNFGSMRDPQKQKAAKQRWYERNKAVYLERNQRRREERLQLIHKLRENPCTDCGQHYPFYVMEFDHREGEEKVDAIANLAANGSLKALLAELGKCDVVCANCHRARTYFRRQKASCRIVQW